MSFTWTVASFQFLVNFNFPDSIEAPLTPPPSLPPFCFWSAQSALYKSSWVQFTLHSILYYNSILLIKISPYHFSYCWQWYLWLWSSQTLSKDLKKVKSRACWYLKEGIPGRRGRDNTQCISGGSEPGVKLVKWNWRRVGEVEITAWALV